MIKALAFGGAFNPPTIAHIACARYVLDTLHYEKVIFIPTKREYVLEDQKKGFSFTNEQRLSILKAIAKTNPWMVVEDYEIQSQTQPRTYTTLCYLKQQGYDVQWLCGSDKLPELQNGWKYVHELINEFGLVCMTRSHEDVETLIDSDEYLKTLKHGITVVHTPDTLQSVSSTEVRRLLQLRKEVGDNKDIENTLNALLPLPLEELEKLV